MECESLVSAEVYVGAKCRYMYISSPTNYFVLLCLLNKRLGVQSYSKNKLELKHKRL